MGHNTAKRIVVIGNSNAGKTTLAARLAETMGVPLVELDGLHWEPGWVAADDDVFRERVRRAIEAPSWILAGNYIRQQQAVSWPAADTIVWLDLSLPTVLRRCVRRTWRRWRTREVLYGGSNRENVWEHLKLWDPDKSLVAHILRTHRRRRHDFEAMSREPRWAHLTFIRLRSVAEIEQWFSTVRGRAVATSAGRERSAEAQASIS